MNKYKKPTVEAPSDEELEDMVTDQIDCTATDGCIVEPDGICPHDYNSWLVYLGFI